MAMNKKNVSESDTENTEKTTENEGTATAETTPAPPITKERYDGITSFVYIEPSLPGGRLKSMSTFNGTYAQITNYHKDAIEQFPSVTRLIVPIAQLAEAREKTQTSGNLMYNYYQEVDAAIKAKGVE